MNRPETVTASEIADFVYCPESFRLSAIGHQSANQAARHHGTAHHTAKAASERVSAYDRNSSQSSAPS